MRRVFLTYFLMLLLCGSVCAAPPKKFNFTTYFAGKDLCRKWFQLLAPGEFDRLERETEKGTEIVDVQMGDEISVEAPTQCITGGIATCLGIALINVRTNKAYLNHHYGDGGYETSVELALSEAMSPGDLRVALVGNVLMRNTTEKSYYLDLPFEVIDYLKKHGIPEENIATALGNRGEIDGVYKVRVDPESKTIFATSEPIELGR